MTPVDTIMRIFEIKWWGVIFSMRMYKFAFPSIFFNVA